MEQSAPKTERVQTVLHNYGGWYCPDNLNGFPAVDIADWRNVPVVIGRMPTEAETRDGRSLIFVDPAEYPNAKPLDMPMPRLAHYYNESSNRKDLVVVIQAFHVANDSVVGFRYLNGGNGSARLSEVQFLTDAEINKLPKTRFIAQTVSIHATPEAIWEVLTTPEYSDGLEEIMDGGIPMKRYSAKTSNVNFHYPNSGELTSAHGGDVFGNRYIQNDYAESNYTEKFLLLADSKTKTTTLKIVTGPYGKDFENQKRIMDKWAEKVKALSEGE